MCWNLSDCLLFDVLQRERELSILRWIHLKPLFNQPVHHGKLKLKEQQTGWGKFHFKVTIHVRDTFLEALLSECPLYFNLVHLPGSHGGHSVRFCALMETVHVQWYQDPIIILGPCWISIYLCHSPLPSPWLWLPPPLLVSLSSLSSSYILDSSVPCDWLTSKYGTL